MKLDYTNADNITPFVIEFENFGFGEAESKDNLPKDYVIEFLKKSTLFNDMMHTLYEDYVTDFVERAYDTGTWDERSLKRFIMLSYPMAVLEKIIQPEKIREYRNIQTGIYPHNEINAFATKSPDNRKAVFFSESLFSFLWDYYNVDRQILKVGTRPEEITPKEAKQIDEETAKIINTFVTGEYPKWDTKKMLSYSLEANSSKVYHLYSLVYIHAHELGHLYLNHLNDASLKPVMLTNYEDDVRDVMIYNPSQENELDADMFASDIYFEYIYNGFRAMDEKVFKKVHLSGFDMLREMAKLEQKKNWKNQISNTHPPSGMRLVYMVLRHRDKFLKQGYDHLIEPLLESLEKNRNNMAPYDFDKEIGASKIFKRNTEVNKA